MKKDSSTTRPVRLRDRFREETSRAILAAAEEVFAAEGLRGARMELIAARAGVAVGTLYNHFADRGALFDELVRSRRAALLAKLDEAVAAGARLPLPEALHRFLQALFRHWAAHARFMGLLFQAERPHEPVRARGSERTTRQEIVARADTLVRRGIAAGTLRAAGGELHTAALVGLAWGVLMAARADERLDRVEDDVGHVVELFLHGAGR